MPCWRPIPKRGIHLWGAPVSAVPLTDLGLAPPFDPSLSWAWVRKATSEVVESFAADVDRGSSVGKPAERTTARDRGAREPGLTRLSVAHHVPAHRVSKENRA